MALIKRLARINAFNSALMTTVPMLMLIGALRDAPSAAAKSAAAKSAAAKSAAAKSAAATHAPWSAPLWAPP